MSLLKRIHAHHIKTSTFSTSPTIHKGKRKQTPSRAEHLGTMCYVIFHVHAECEHEKKKEIVEFCEDFAKEECILVPVFFKQVTAPSLCLECFREVEADIDASYHRKTDLIRGQMAEHEATQPDRQIIGRAEATIDGYIAILERALVREKEHRDLSISRFRSQQGVWADG